MTIEERNIKLKHYITCLKCELSGKSCEPDCITQFEAGNFGEIIENLEAISEIIEQQLEAWGKIDDEIASLQDMYSIGGTDTEKAIWENLQVVRKTIHEYLSRVEQ